MSPGGRLRSESLRAMARDRRAVAQDRALLREMVGAPPHPLLGKLDQSDPAAGSDALPVGTVIPYSLRAIQERAVPARAQSVAQTPPSSAVAGTPQLESSADRIDMHSHLAAPENSMMVDFLAGTPGSVQSGWDNQYGLASRLQNMVIAGNPVYDTQFDEGTFAPDSVVDYWNTTARLNLATLFYTSHDATGFFLPFAMVPHYELGSAKALRIVSDFIGVEGLSGIGEILVHGHGIDSPASTGTNPYIQSATNDRLLPYVRLAALNDVPIMFHWDIGSVDADSQNADTSAFSAELSGRQLKALLDMNAAGFAMPGEVEGYETTPHVAKIIIAHCGAGPNARKWAAHDVEFDAWIAAMNYLLSNYETVYFDVAGLEIDGATKPKNVWSLFDAGSLLLTEFGKALAVLIEAYPTRFLFGLDGTSSASPVPINDEMIDYIDTYISEVYSQLGIVLDSGKLYLDNADEVLYSTPTV